MNFSNEIQIRLIFFPPFSLQSFVFQSNSFLKKEKKQLNGNLGSERVQLYK